MTIAPWHADRSNMVLFLRYLADAGFKGEDIVDAFDHPEEWDIEWDECQRLVEGESA